MRASVLCAAALAVTASLAASSRPAPPSFDSKRVVAKAREVASKELKYLWGSKEIDKGGLDCSGFICTVFQEAAGIIMPGTASMQYRYVQDHGIIFPTRWLEDGQKDVTGIQPGDLLFWQYTRATNRKPPVGHVMLYIGEEGGKMLMAGAQTAGTYKGKKVRGVAIYEFNPDDPHGGLKDKDGQYVIRGELLGWGRILPEKLRTSK